MSWYRSSRRKALDSFGLGKAALDAEDLDRAIHWFSDAIQQDHSFVSGYYGRGLAYLKKHDYDPAITDFTEAIRLCPDNPYCYFFRSVSYSGKGDIAHEKADYDKARQLDPRVEEAVEQAAEGPASVRGLRGRAIVLLLRAALKESLAHEVDENVRSLAMKAISEIEPATANHVPGLIEALGDETPAVRCGAAHVLGNLGVEANAAMDALTEVLRDSDARARVQAALALWKIGRRSQLAVPVLIEALRADDEFLCWIAADGLGDIGPEAKAAVPALLEIWQGDIKLALIRKGVLLALERIDPKAAPRAEVS